MAKVAITERFVDAFLKAIYPDPKGEDRRTAHAEKKRDRIKELFYNDQADFDGPGMVVDGSRTAYGLYNAATQYWQHEATTRTRSGKDYSEEKKFNNMMVGTQEQRRGEFLEGLLNKDNLMAAVKVGKVSN